MFKNEVVHLPKFPLQACSFYGEGGIECVRVEFLSWIVSENELELVAELVLEGFDSVVGISAIRTFVVTVFDEGNGCVCWSLGVIGGSRLHLVVGYMGKTIRQFLSYAHISDESHHRTAYFSTDHNDRGLDDYEQDKVLHR
jgi:hypothetical protein